MENFLGEKLKAFRQENGLTQKQLADLLYVSDKTISKWERGAGKPDIDMLKNVADLLELSVDDILQEQEPSYYYEYQSDFTIWGLPLLHIILPNLGEIFRHHLLFRRSGKNLFLSPKIPTAKGIFSAGVRSKGIFSVGIFSLGIFSFGIISLGLLAGGLVSVGAIALGNAAIGLFGLGNLAIAPLAIGNLAIGYFSLGNLAVGVFAIGNQSSGTWAYSLGDKINLADIQQTMHSLQQETIPELARTMLIQPLTQFFDSEWLFPVLIIGLVGLVLTGVIVLIITAMLQIFKTRWA